MESMYCIMSLIGIGAILGWILCEMKHKFKAIDDANDETQRRYTNCLAVQQQEIEELKKQVARMKTFEEASRNEE